VYSTCAQGCSVSTLPPGIIEHKSVDRVFNQLGPTARLCIDYLCSRIRLEWYEHETEKAISTMTTKELKKLFEDSSSLAMDSVSHKICLISRQDREDVFSKAIVAPITSSIQSRLADHFRTLEHQEQIRLYKRFSEVPALRATTGIFFEAAARRLLEGGVTLTIVPMVRLPYGNLWYTSHVPLSNATLEASRQEARQQRLWVIIPRCWPIEYSDGGPPFITSDVLYVPEMTNQVALDSFIIINGLLYILQFTVARDQGMNPGLIDFVGKCSGLPSVDDWRFIFIHPPNHTLVCPRPWKPEIQKLQPYSAVLTL
jgi:hypothetical protein